MGSLLPLDGGKRFDFPLASSDTGREGEGCLITMRTQSRSPGPHLDSTETEGHLLMMVKGRWPGSPRGLSGMGGGGPVLVFVTFG